ncbi:hypothetical protein [Demequina aurantiaca]|uniref:hypothetical protein n=1 Tax=Demequina aurantiaca TaxID=676200 RepID=UPI000AA37521|nr:hypothetical protein [Demequina aurantiaca]
MRVSPHARMSLAVTAVTAVTAIAAVALTGCAPADSGPRVSWTLPVDPSPETSAPAAPTASAQPSIEATDAVGANVATLPSCDTLRGFFGDTAAKLGEHPEGTTQSYDDETGYGIGCGWTTPLSPPTDEYMAALQAGDLTLVVVVDSDPLTPIDGDAFGDFDVDAAAVEAGGFVVYDDALDPDAVVGHTGVSVVFGDTSVRITPIVLDDPEQVLPELTNQRVLDIELAIHKELGSY